MSIRTQLAALQYLSCYLFIRPGPSGVVARGVGVYLSLARVAESQKQRGLVRYLWYDIGLWGA